MRARQVWLAGAVLALGVLAGCGDDGPEPAPKWAVPETSRPPGQEAAPLSSREETFLAELATIDEKAAAAEDAVDNGRATCRDIDLDKTTKQITKNATVRFQVDNATARKIVKSVRANLCGS